MAPEEISRAATHPFIRPRLLTEKIGHARDQAMFHAQKIELKSVAIREDLDILYLNWLIRTKKVFDLSSNFFVSHDQLIPTVECLESLCEKGVFVPEGSAIYLPEFPGGLRQMEMDNRLIFASEAIGFSVE